jgi:hypothetical protein
MHNFEKIITQRALRIAYVGADWPFGVNMDGNLIFRIIKKICREEIQIVQDVRNADLVIAYPYLVGNTMFKVKWLLSTLTKKIFPKFDSAKLFRWMLGVGNKPVLFISHENLDRPFWWNMLGKFLINTNIPRLTFWPTKIDPRGCRFPYWYNYVEWADYPRVSNYTRFGRFYTIQELTQPLKFDADREDAIVVISSHLDYPRAGLVAALTYQKRLDRYGKVGIAFKGPKIGIMKKYRYAFCAENSVGFGYDTEKIPEAWAAGCLPVGVFLNPFSDFNRAVIDMDPNDPKSYAAVPLLKFSPSLRDIEAYVKEEFF